MDNFAGVTVKLVLYVLELEDDCYYIGISSNLNYRLAQHESGGGSKWVKLHKFKSLLEVRYPVTNGLEDKVTLEYMKKFGYDKVRGGSYSKVSMNREPIVLRIEKGNNSGHKRLLMPRFLK